MKLKLESVTIDCANPDTSAAWWAHAVDGTVNAVVPGEFVLVAQQEGPNLAFQHVDDLTPGKNRIHVDFSASDMEQEVARLVALGATEHDRQSFGDDFQWVVLADPDGNLFCIAQGE
ncbi:MAG: glyoxalase [Mycobacterium sp.]|nr:glyoxalase [Mycobacterium sp.]